MFSCEYYEVFKNTYFEEYLWSTASASAFPQLEKHVLNLIVNMGSPTFSYTAFPVCKVHSFPIVLGETKYESY